MPDEGVYHVALHLASKSEIGGGPAVEIGNDLVGAEFRVGAVFNPELDLGSLYRPSGRVADRDRKGIGQPMSRPSLLPAPLNHQPQTVGLNNGVFRIAPGQYRGGRGDTYRNNEGRTA